jgi:hypothetical protein
MLNPHLVPRNPQHVNRNSEPVMRHPKRVRKILTTKSEITQLTSLLLPNKVSCQQKPDGPFPCCPNRDLKRMYFEITAIPIALFLRCN